MPANLEIKARIASSNKAVETARSLDAVYCGDLYQTDTYFCAPNGRLKLREIRGQQSELIFYERGEKSARRHSEFKIYPVEDGLGLKNILEHAMGIRAFVEKKRALFLYESARIHIDEVVDLGQFIEFEVPVSDVPGPAERMMEFLMGKFHIEENDCICHSYVDMIQKSYGITL